MEDCRSRPKVNLSLPFRALIVLFLFLVSGCSQREDPASFPPASPSAVPRKPEISLALGPGADRDNLKPGAQAEVVCTVTVEAGEFEPMLALFQLIDSMSKGKSKTIITSFGVNEKAREGVNYTFLYKMKVPEKPGRYVVEATVIGADASLPSDEPPQAPTVDGKTTTPGARAEFEAPPLKIQVKK